jgi:FixJ family two-component response regulator
LEKPIDDNVLLDAVENAVELDVRLRRENEEKRAVEEKMERLTPREDEVLSLVVDECLTSKNIAGRLSVSVKTVEAHRAAIMGKMEAPTVAHLVKMVVSHDTRTPRAK